MKTPSLPTLFLILALGSALIIGSALFSQYVLAMDPCGLCLRQRLGHYVAILMALTAALSFARRSGEPTGQHDFERCCSASSGFFTVLGQLPYWRGAKMVARS